jgi:hypothetical protein
VAHRYLLDVLAGELPSDDQTAALQGATNQLAYSAGQADLWGPDEVASKAQEVVSQGQEMTTLLRRWHGFTNQGEGERVAHQQACASQLLALTDARMSFMSHLTREDRWPSRPPALPHPHLPALAVLTVSQPVHCGARRPCGEQAAGRGRLHPWEELRQGRLARSPANVRLLPDGSSARPRPACIAFSDSAAKQLETITSVTALRTVVVVAYTEAEMRWLGKLAAA